MNLNLITYSIFFAIVVYIILVVGRICYKNGNVYVLSLMPGHEDLCIRINKILLIGYYLVNIGYAAMTFISWETVITIPQLIETIAIKTAIIVGILSILHYSNIFILTRYAKNLIH